MSDDEDGDFVYKLYKHLLHKVHVAASASLWAAGLG